MKISFFKGQGCTVAELITALQLLDPQQQVYSQCPETDNSWSLRGLVTTPQGVIILIDELDGPRTPN